MLRYTAETAAHAIYHGCNIGHLPFVCVITISAYWVDIEERQVTLEWERRILIDLYGNVIARIWGYESGERHPRYEV